MYLRYRADDVIELFLFEHFWKDFIAKSHLRCPYLHDNSVFPKVDEINCTEESCGEGHFSTVLPPP